MLSRDKLVFLHNGDMLPAMKPGEVSGLCPINIPHDRKFAVIYRVPSFIGTLIYFTSSHKTHHYKTAGLDLYFVRDIDTGW